MSTSPEYLLARMSPKPSAWNFYPSLEAAQLAAPQVNADNQGDGAPYEPMTFDAFLAAERAHYVKPGELHEIDADRFHEMLNVLPPMRWEHRDGVERFLMCEMLTGSITSQFARLGETEGTSRYFTRNADARDRSTYITAAECRAWIQEHAPRKMSHLECAELALEFVEHELARGTYPDPTDAIHRQRAELAATVAHLKAQEPGPC
jgi:hypothetical protein